MQEPEPLQKQRHILRQFRRAAEKRTTTEQEIEAKQKNGLAEAAESVATAKQSADGLQNQTHQNYQKAQDILESVGLTRLLPERVPPAALTLQAGDIPGKELTRVASKTDPISDQINKNVIALKQWRARRKMQKQILFFAGAATLLVLTIALIYTYQAWATNHRYEQAVAALATEDWEKARSLFQDLGDYKDSYTFWQESSYQHASAALASGEWTKAGSLFSDLGSYKNSYSLRRESYYQQAIDALAVGEWKEARSLFKELDTYKDSRVLMFTAICSPPANPTLGDTCRRRTDDMTMVYVPEGTFLMGGSSETELPVQEVRLDSFWLDRTEVTNAQYERCVTAGRCTRSKYADNRDYNGAQHPVVGISWYDAWEYCTWVGGQLPTEAQWEYAARGPQAYTYPWGNNSPNCNLAQYGACPGKTKPVGSFSPVGDSWVGAADMAGNVSEWVVDRYDPDYYFFITIRGGDFTSNGNYVSSSTRSFLTPDFLKSNQGFRCAWE